MHSAGSPRLPPFIKEPAALVFHASPSSLHTLASPCHLPEVHAFLVWVCSLCLAHTFSPAGCGEGDRTEQMSTWFILRKRLTPLEVGLVGAVRGRVLVCLLWRGLCPVHPGAVNTEARFCSAQTEGTLGLFSALLARDCPFSVQLSPKASLVATGHPTPASYPGFSPSAYSPVLRGQSTIPKGPC